MLEDFLEIDPGYAGLSQTWNNPDFNGLNPLR